MRSVKVKNEAISSELKAKGSIGFEMDVTNEDSVNSGVKSAIEMMGSLDIVFNNAGIETNGILECFTASDIQNV